MMMKRVQKGEEVSSRYVTQFQLKRVAALGEEAFLAPPHFELHFPLHPSESHTQFSLNTMASEIFHPFPRLPLELRLKFGV
jgi:hypothetical protein